MLFRSDCHRRKRNLSTGWVNVKKCITLYIMAGSRLSCVMKSAKTAMEDVGLELNPKKCAVAYFKRGVHVVGSRAVKVNGNAKIPSLENGEQYKFLGVLESLESKKRS